jgi:hypothetical protein
MEPERNGEWAEKENENVQGRDVRETVGETERMAERGVGGGWGGGWVGWGVGGVGGGGREQRMRRLVGM